MEKSGVLLLNKPKGLSSNALVGKMKRLLGAQKAGHTGTLDPMAEGLLPICFNEATKFSADVLHSEKGYLAHIQLGVATDSGDKEGKVIFKEKTFFSRETIEENLKSFIGKQKQIPPIYSALKFQGRALYQWAREGVKIEKQAREVEFFKLLLQDFDEPKQIAQVEILCSKGTYIRALARDLGEKLHSGAHLIALTRTQTGPFFLKDAVDLAFFSEEKLPPLLPIDSLLPHLARVDLNVTQKKAFLNGNALPIALPWESDSLCRVYGENLFLGTGIFKENTLYPKRVRVFPR